MAKKNFTISAVATAPSPATTGTSLVVTTGEGSRFAENETAHVFPDGVQPVPENAEVILITDVSTDTLTIVREQEDSSARTIVEGDIIMQGLTAGTWNDLITFKNHANSPFVYGGAITEGTTGTFTVASLVAYLRTTNSEVGELTGVVLAEQSNQSITSSDTTYFVCLDYNDGTPQIVLSTTHPYARVSAPDKTQIVIGKVMKDSSDDVHFISGGFNFQDGVMKLHQRAGSLRSKELASGSDITYSGTNNFEMEAGIAYVGINRIILATYDSAVVQFTPVYGDGSDGFTEGADRNTIDYEHYDDGDGTLGNVGNSKYGCHWIYRHIGDGHVYVVYGGCSGSLATAENEQEPLKPDHLTDFGMLIGCIVAPQAGGSFATIQMVTDTFFTGTSTSDHGSLGGLSDDDHTQYLRADGTRELTDDMAVTADKTIDGRDLSVDGAKLDTIEESADVNNISDVNATDLTDGGDTTLHDHDGISENTTARHTQGTDTDLDSTFEATFVKKTDTVNVLSDITSAGVDIEDAVTKKHTQGTDTALGAQAENLDMNTHKIVGVVDPTANQEAATKKYVDDNVPSGVVLDDDFDAHTILRATADDTPVALTIAEERMLGRLSGGNITGLSTTEIRTLINVEDNADVTDAVNIASSIVGVAGKTTPIDADSFGLIDSADSNSLKELTLANLKIAILKATYPIGCIYTTIVATNPNTVFGFGTWTAFGAGKVPVGLNSGDADFNTVEETGGAKTIDIEHKHIQTTGSDGAGLYLRATNPYGSAVLSADRTLTTMHNRTTGAGRYDYTSGALSDAQSIVQPYITVYMWKRTA